MNDLAGEMDAVGIRRKHAIAAPKRYPCGKRKPTKGGDVRRDLQKLDDDMRLAETAQVAGQPHRGGNRSDMAESALGRFILVKLAEEKEQDRRAIYDTALSYFRLVCFWRRMKGIPLPHQIVFDSAMEIPPEKELDERVRKTRARIDAYELAMKCVRMTGFIATRNLILDDLEPRPILHGLVRTALLRLHEEF